MPTNTEKTSLDKNVSDVMSLNTLLFFLNEEMINLSKINTISAQVMPANM